MRKLEIKPQDREVIADRVRRRGDMLASRARTYPLRPDHANNNYAFACGLRAAAEYIRTGKWPEDAQ